MSCQCPDNKQLDKLIKRHHKMIQQQTQLVKQQNLLIAHLDIVHHLKKFSSITPPAKQMSYKDFNVAVLDYITSLFGVINAFNRFISNNPTCKSIKDSKNSKDCLRGSKGDRCV
jgi:hypothetical protein